MRRPGGDAGFSLPGIYSSRGIVIGSEGRFAQNTLARRTISQYNFKLLGFLEGQRMVIDFPVCANQRKGDDMNGKLWKCCVAGLLLLDIFLFAIPAGLPSGCGKYLPREVEKVALQRISSELVSPYPGFVRGQTADNLSATAILLLSLLTL